MGSRHHEGRLAGDAHIDLHGLPRDDHETREIVAVILDVAAQHVQAVQARRRLAVCALDPLVGDALQSGSRLGEQPRLLAAQRVVDDFVKDPGHEIRIQTDIAAGRDQLFQYALLARRIPHGYSSPRLRLKNMHGQPAALGERLQDLPVHRSYPIANGVDLPHGSILPRCRTRDPSRK